MSRRACEVAVQFEADPVRFPAKPGCPFTKLLRRFPQFGVLTVEIGEVTHYRHSACRHVGGERAKDPFSSRPPRWACYSTSAAAPLGARSSSRSARARATRERMVPTGHAHTLAASS